jgi:L-fucose isomerase-like protein
MQALEAKEGKTMSQRETIYLISNGDFRDTAAEMCWPVQQKTIGAVQKSFELLEIKSKVMPEYDTKRKHGFLTRQYRGTDLFATIDPTSPVVIVLSCWAYAHHVASGLQTHEGPILLLANFDGTWPGLVALLNHSATLDRLSVPHSRLWTDGFADDPVFMERLKTWIDTGRIEYDHSHLVPAEKATLSDQALKFGQALAGDIVRHKRIMGQLDPGCMGMLNAVMDPAKLGSIGMPLELLNQSDLVAEMALISDQQAQKHLNWLVEQGVWFNWGTDQFEELVHGQVIAQMKMYQAAIHMYQRYGLSAIGIPYQVGLVRSVPASDLAEGMLNNSIRPAVHNPDTGEVVRSGKPIIHFNEGDIGSGIPQVLMSDIYERKGLSPETTLHDIRWGRQYNGRFIWVLEISGGAPPAHFGGWQNTKVFRQPSMYFPLGGGTCSGISKPGVITWARFYESHGAIGLDCGLGEVVHLPDDEITDRLNRTTSQWPIANVYLPNYDRDQCMSSHMSNHITIGYGNILEELVATSLNLGISTRVVGDIHA